MVLIFLLLMGFCSYSIYGMERMTLVAPDRQVQVPLQLANRCERLRSYHEMANGLKREDELHQNNHINRFNPLVYNFAQNQPDNGYVPVDSKVLKNLFRYVEHPEQIQRSAVGLDRLQRLLVTSDYLVAPRNVRTALMRRVLNAIGQEGSQILRPETSGLIYEYLRPATEQGHLDLRGSGLTTVDGLLAFFDRTHYEHADDALNGNTITSLDLSHSRIGELDVQQLLRIFPNLRQLDINHNQLRGIDLRNLPHGFRLDASYNQLEHVSLTRGQNQLSLNFDYNRLIFRARPILRAVNGGDVKSWSRSGISLFVSFFNPASISMRIASAAVRALIAIAPNLIIMGLILRRALPLVKDYSKTRKQILEKIPNTPWSWLIVKSSPELEEHDRNFQIKIFPWYIASLGAAATIMLTAPFVDRNLGWVRNRTWAVFNRGYTNFGSPVVARLNQILEQNRNRLSLLGQNH